MKSFMLLKASFSGHVILYPLHNNYMFSSSSPNYSEGKNYFNYVSHTKMPPWELGCSQGYKVYPFIFHSEDGSTCGIKLGILFIV